MDLPCGRRGIVVLNSILHNELDDKSEPCEVGKIVDTRVERDGAPSVP